MALVMLDDLERTGLVKVERQDILKVIMQFLTGLPPIYEAGRLR